MNEVLLFCICGLQRVKVGRFEYLMCMNCDTVHDEERNGQERVKTAYDYKFEKNMKRKIENWYPE